MDFASAVLIGGILELYFVLKTRSMVAAVMHGTFNAVSGLVIYFVRGGNDLLNGMPGLSGFIVMGLAIVCMVLYDRYIAHQNICSLTLKEALER